MIHFHLSDSLPLEAVCFVLSVAIVVAYHLYLGSRLARNPYYSIQAVNGRAREVWVARIMGASTDKDLLAVQTLRNSTMAATFLASTAILLTIGVLNLSSKGNALGSLLGGHTGVSTSTENVLWGLKLLPMLIDFFWAFFCFSLAVRMYNHVGFLVNARGHSAHSPSPAYVARLLNRGGSYYSFGMRAYYLSVPMVFWLFGPQYLLSATLGVIAVLYHVDRAPDIDDESKPTADEARPAPSEESSALGSFRLVKGR